MWRSARPSHPILARRPNRRSNLHDLLLLGVERLIDVVDMSIGELLQLFADLSVLILSDLMILFGFFEGFHAVAADVANGDPPLLRIFVRKLYQFLAALLVQLRNGDAQQLSVDLGIETEAGIPDRKSTR